MTFVARRRSVAGGLIGASLTAVAVSIAAPAAAECTPAPTAYGVTTLCTGTTQQGLSITGDFVTIGVTPGATLQAGTQDGAVAARARAATVVVAGMIDGGSGTAIIGTAGTLRDQSELYDLTASPRYGPTLTIERSGTVRGATAVRITRNSDNPAPVTFDLSNAGTLAGSGGVAVQAADFGTYLRYVNNSGTIQGSLATSLLSLYNTGVIDGGAGSAVAERPGTVELVFGSDTRHILTNFGTIRSNGTATTLDLQPTKNFDQSVFYPYLPRNDSDTGPVRVENGGTIVNAGAGAAITSPRGLTITNRSTGTIASGGTAIQAGGVLALTNAGRISSGGIAVQAGGALTLVNSGTITGSVVTTGPAGTVSVIDNRAGTIEGNLLFGAGDETFYGRLDAQGRVAGVTGTIDGGAGLDTFGIDVSGRVTLGAVGLPTNFERLSLNLDSAQVSLVADPNLPAGIAIGGRGSFSIDTDLTLRGALLVAGPGGSVAVSNARSIAATLASPDQAALAINGGSIANAGSVVVGGGAGVSAPKVINSGTISASGTAVSTIVTTGSALGVIFPIGGSIQNSGTIRSTGGTGAVLAGNGASTNSGIVEGATYGIESIGGSLVNSGTVSGGTAAILFRPGTTGVGSFNGLTNEASGVVRGGIVGAESNANYGVTANVVNHGLIDGSITLGGGARTSSIDLTNVDGRITGDLRFGDGSDTFYTPLPGVDGRYVGVGGTVDAGGGTDRIVYEVLGGSAAATIVPPPTFEVVGYNVRNGASLTLTAPAPLPFALTLGGAGTVDLTADITATAATALTLQPASYSASDDNPLRLAVTSRGTINFTGGNYNAYAVQASYSRFENTGTINATAGLDYGSPGYAYAINGGGTIVNSGTITIAGRGRAITNDTGYNLPQSAIVNSGTIRQAAGSGAASGGVYTTGTLTNSGTISVGDVAAYATNVANSGLIESRTSTGLIFYNSAGGTLLNAAGGVIRGATVAISGARGSIINEGTISGNVELGTGGYRFSLGGSSYVAAGGMLTGNLTFGAGNDVFIQRGATTGVTGIIDAGAGFDIYGRSYASSTTYAPGAALPTTFEGELIEASGADTTITLVNPAGSARDLYLVGDGRIVNQTQIAGSVIGLDPTSYLQGVRIAAFTNRASIGGSITGAFQTFVNDGATIAAGVRGEIQRFTNSGTIGTAGTVTDAVSIQNSGDRFDFVNSGTIRASSGGGYGVLASAYGGARGFSFQNSGRIEGPVVAQALLAADTKNGAFTAVNSGTIATNLDDASAFWANFYTGGCCRPTEQTGNMFTLANSGTIHAGGIASAAVVVKPAFEDTDFRITITNSGTIESLGNGYLETSTVVDRTFFSPSAGILVDAAGDSTNRLVTIDNAATGTIAIAGRAAVAIAVFNTPLVLNNAGTIRGSDGTAIPENTSSLYPVRDYLGGAVQAGGFADHVVNTGLIAGWMDLGGGDDVVENRGQITGDVFLRGGDDHWIQLAAATLAGTADGGDGIDTLTFDATQGGVVDPLRIGRYSHFERFEQIGNGAVSYSGTIPFDTIYVEGGVVMVSAGQTLATGSAVTVTGSDADEAVVNNGSIAGAVDLGGGNDMVVLNGATGGMVSLGAGDDRLVIATPLVIAADGGAGADTLVYAGAAASPIEVRNVPGFENLQVSSGVATQSGAENFAQVMVTGGRLTGQAGSSLTAPTIGVAAGGTYGTAGTVTGNVAVAGTLSPGASPGAMTVNGNVALAAGSTSLFELTPTVTDRLLVSGTLTIASGATLALTGERPLTPGTSLDLIVADTIVGDFSTITKPATILGFVAKRGNAIQLLGQFAINPTDPAQAQAGLAYLNGLLTATPSAALINALPSLLTGTGAASPAAFAQLTPEVYASARQIGVENGLMIADAARARTLASGRAEPAAFVFADAIGGWRDLHAGPAGTTHADIDSRGGVVGLGWDGGDWAVGVFGGYLDSRQRVPALGRTDADGAIGGVQARYDMAGIKFAALVAYDGGDAHSRRVVPAGTVDGRFKMHGFTVDASARYGIASWRGWTLNGGAGLTYIWQRRGATGETGGSPFALSVAADRDNAGFASISLDLAGSLGEGERLHPYLSASARHQFEGRRSVALAGFGGGAATLVGTGVNRGSLLGTLAAGLGYDLATGATLYAGYAGERGHGDRRDALTGGLRFRF